ncbi:PilZ domain-containing protein [endosymbiont of Riftia pachyptila]|uniref:PilZ domain-containing protein n=1 Tax=endosymbiont of Riftia pachyptila (vent Ph05) TaxID=1048808 RepID=G2DDP0_9GAMM|nr:PilZ domain-containing protein [endosymbiont of Riftia pachyptila]EGV51270.1 hypothetical protein Rifp1Sym_bp00170 [endosymbiont of Riftia pachyptila (vent Ph05)]
MTIEKRYNRRIPITFDVQIIHRNRCITAQANGTSSTGISLRDKALTIPTGRFIEMSFNLGAHQWQVFGLVIWSTPEQIGIMFQFPQPELFETVFQLKSTLEKIRENRRAPIAAHSLPC